MNELLLDASVLRLAAGWDEAFWPRLLIGLLGVLAVATAGLSCRKQTMSRLSCLFWTLIGVGLLVFACFPQQIITSIVSTEYMMRIRTIMVVVSIAVLLVTLESIRRTHMQERYALLWISTALAVTVAALFPHVVDLFRAVMGMTYVAAVVSVAFLFLMLVAFHFSISLSSIVRKQSSMAQRIAILEERLRQCEAGESATTPRHDDG